MKKLILIVISLSIISFVNYTKANCEQNPNETSIVRTQKFRHDKLMDSIKRVKGELEAVPDPGQSFISIRDIIDNAPNGEKEQYKKIVCDEMLSILNAYSDEKIKDINRKYLRPEDLDKEVENYKRAVIELIGEYCNMTSTKAKNDLFDVATSDKHMVVREEARRSLIKLGDEDRVVPLIIKEVENTPPNKKIYELPGSEMYGFKNLENFNKVKNKLNSIVNDKYNNYVKRNAAYLLLLEYKYYDSKKFWSSLKDKESKLKAIELMKYLNDEKANKMLKEKSISETDPEIRQKIKITLENVEAQ